MSKQKQQQSRPQPQQQPAAAAASPVPAVGQPGNTEETRRRLLALAQSPTASDAARALARAALRLPAGGGGK